MDQRGDHERCLTSHEIWEDAASRATTILSTCHGPGYKLAPMTYEEMEEYLKALKQQHARKRSSRWFKRLDPVVRHLRTFSDAIGVFTQSNPEISCLVWGSLRLVLDAASSFSRTLEKTITMYEEISHSMPRFEEYMQIFPRRQRLQLALHRIYTAYLGFAAKAAMLFSHNALRHVWMNFIKFGSLTATFDDVIDDIQKAALDFEAEAALAHTASMDQKLTEITNALPNVDVHIQPPKSVFSVPWSRDDKFFEGRDELTTLHGFLAPDDLEQRSCVLHGMAGVGKTHAALEFTFRYRHVYPYIFWVRAEDEAVLKDDFGRIARLLNLSSDDKTKDLDLLVETALTWLRQNPSWLIVFDNAEASALLNRYWPACEHGSILITTQEQKLAHRSRSNLHLTSLTEEEGSCLLFRHLPEESKSSHSALALTRDLSREVRGLPLLLVGLAGHMADSHLTLSETLNELQQSWNKSDNIIENICPDSATFQYQSPIHTLFNMSLSRLSPVAMSVLRIMSMLSADGISEDLVVLTSQDPSGQMGQLESRRFRSQLRHQFLSRNLVEFRKAESDQPLYTLHRQLQWKILMDLRSNTTMRQQTFDQAVSLVRKDFPRLSEFMIPMFAKWDSYKRSIAHVLRLQEVYEAFSSDELPIHGHVAFAELLASAGNYLYEVSIVDSGLAVLSTSAEICRKLRLALAPSQDAADFVILPQEVQNTLAELIKLEATALTVSWGIVEQSRGLSVGEEAMDYIGRALKLRELHAAMDLSEEEQFSSLVLLSNAFNDMACHLINNHKYDEAESYLHSSLSLKEKLNRLHDIPEFEYAESKNNLASVRLGQSRVEEALRFSHEATELIDKVDGHANDYTRFFFGMGVCYYWAGQLEKALQIFQRMYKVRVTTFGRSSRNARHSAFAIAMVFYRLGKLESAREAIVNCFGQQGSDAWPEECLVRAQYLHSMILRALGDINKADELSIKANAGLRDLLPACWPELLGVSASTSLDSVDPLILCDFIVPSPAGRFASYNWRASPVGKTFVCIP